MGNKAVMIRDDIITIYRMGQNAIVEAVTRLSDHISELELRIEELEARSNKDSHNSSKPPSSDKSGNKANAGKK
ncbi:MAG: DUF6444 domain-containing protein, partial [Armatimonadota bacterium]|nr:DUF6444 domain-containing protein [Armatimonadota bacterium]